MEDVKYSAVIVIYNKTIDDSITCHCIKEINDLDLEIVVVDNSESDKGNKKICEDNGYKYISMHGNKGLSKAYNAAIDSTDSDIIIILDDDTELTNDYFKKLNYAVLNNDDVDVFAPIVYGQDGVIYSPNKFNFLKNHFIDSVDQDVDQEHFNAIASCLAIRRRVFENYRFDEMLFVDQVDQYFFCQQRNLGRKFMKLDTVINQSFYQRGDTLSAESGWKRVKLRIVDVMRHAKLMGGLEYKVLGFVKCCGLSAQIAKKTKSVRVLAKGFRLSVKLLFVLPRNNIN
jgi:GT2 family glycosyltransferase